MSITREVFSFLTENLLEREVLILLGARQVGKTFLMRELEKLLRLKKKKVKFFDLELPDHSRLFDRDKSELYSFLTEDCDYLFIDEFQYFENASKLFKAIYDDRRINVKVIASGSSSLDMHKHLKESLAGRKIEKIIRPLSFVEYSQKINNFEDYLVYGGYPGLLAKSKPADKRDLLKQILQTYIMKDIKGLVKEENISAFNNLLYHLAQAQKQVLPTATLANELRVTEMTVEHYISILEQTYVLYRIPSFSQNLSNELKKSKKYYFYDNGIRNAVINNFMTIKNREDKSSLYEAYVCHFLKNHLPSHGELRFWRTKTGDEIDFILLINHEPIIFEVKSKLNSLEIPKSIKTFIKNYPKLKKAFILNENLEGEAYHLGFKVSFIRLKHLEYDPEILEIFEDEI